MERTITRWLPGLALLTLALALFAGAMAGPTRAQGVTPDHLTQHGLTCIQPRLDPTLLLCAPPGRGLPPLPGTEGFADETLRTNSRSSNSRRATSSGPSTCFGASTCVALLRAPSSPGR